MTRKDVPGPKKTKGLKLKSSTCVPTASFLGGMRTPQMTIGKGLGRFQTSKLKALAGGGFRIHTETRSSAVNASRAEAKRTSVLDHLRAWMGLGSDNGWDEGYVNNFIADDQPPPEQDPDLDLRNRPRGHGVSEIYQASLDDASDVGNRTQLYTTGCRESTISCALLSCWRAVGEIHRCIVRNAGTQITYPLTDALSVLEWVSPVLSACGYPILTPLFIAFRYVSSGIDEARWCIDQDSQRWNGTFFEKTSLKSLGLRIQLGHVTGERCFRPEKAKSDDFVILDLDAVHEVALDFCGCGGTSLDHVSQLMERRLFPATVTQPKTAATFRLLEFFEVLQYESKISPFEVFTTISRLTDNTGLLEVKVRN